MSLLQEIERFGLADCAQNRIILNQDKITQQIADLKECIENQLILIHKTENKDLVQLAVKTICIMQRELDKLEPKH